MGRHKKNTRHPRPLWFVLNVNLFVNAKWETNLAGSDKNSNTKHPQVATPMCRLTASVPVDMIHLCEKH